MSTIITEGLGAPLLLTQGFVPAAAVAQAGPDGRLAPPDNSNRMPDGGYLLPLWPPGWLNAADPNTAAWFGGHDQAHEGARQFITTFKQAHLLPYATGDNLDALGKLIGVLRLPSEAGDDGRYRSRIAATAARGLSACTAPDMAAYLAAALGVPVTVSTGPTLAQITVTLLDRPADPGSVVALVRKVKLAGTLVQARMRVIPNAGAGVGRLGSFRIGDQAIGGPAYFISLG